MLTDTPTTERLEIAEYANTALPAWFQQVLGVYGDGIATAFLLYGNVQDYLGGGREVLRQMLARIDAEIIFFYNKSEGWVFADEADAQPVMKDKALKVLGLVAASDPKRAAAGLAVAGQGGNQPQPELPRNPSAALALIEDLLKTDLTRLRRLCPPRATPQLGSVEGSSPSLPSKAVVAVIEYANFIVPAGDLGTMGAEASTNLLTVRRWGRDPQIEATGNFVFLVAPDLASVHPTIREADAKWEPVAIPIPNQVQRESFITFFCAEPEDPEDQERTRGERITWEVQPTEVARLSSGLSLVGVDDIMLRAWSRGRMTREFVRERKEGIFKSQYGDVLNIIEPRFGLEAIGGYEEAKRFIGEQVIAPVREGYLQIVPVGGLLAGPPGTGKSVFVEAVAGESKLPFAKLNIGGLLGSLVGESESKLERALAGIEAASPLILLMDEIEEQLLNRERGGPGDNTGISNRILARFLEWLADRERRGQVVVFGVTNRPDDIDPAVVRSGRLGEFVIPFLAPVAAARKLIIQVQAVQAGLVEAGDTLKVSNQLVGHTEGWTGADIGAGVRKAMFLRYSKNLSVEQALEQALMGIKVRPQKAEYTRMALARCSDPDLVPKEYLQLWEAINTPDEVDADLPSRVAPVGRRRREVSLAGYNS